MVKALLGIKLENDSLQMWSPFTHTIIKTHQGPARMCCVMRTAVKMHLVNSKHKTIKGEQRSGKERWSQTLQRSLWLTLFTDKVPDLLLNSATRQALGHACQGFTPQCSLWREWAICHHPKSVCYPESPWENTAELRNVFMNKSGK